MKKSLLAFSAACIALSASAAAPTQKFEPAPQAPFAKASDIKTKGSLRVGVAPKAFKKAPAKAAGPESIITSAEGRRQDITLTGSGYYLMYDMFDDMYFDQNVATHMVYGEGNEVYLYNPLPNLNAGSYIKGVKEGDNVTFEFPQTLKWYDEYVDGYQISLFEYFEFEGEPDEETGEPVIYYSYTPSEATTLTFSPDEDGRMRADGLSEEGLVVGAGYCSDGQWAGYGAFELSYVDFNEVLVVAPDDIEVSKDFYSYVCPELGYGWGINLAQGGTELYFQGFSSVMPEAWIKATVEYGDTEAIVSIAQDQYVGVYYGEYVFTKAACVAYDEEYDWYYYELMPDGYEYQLVWDYEENTLTPRDPEVTLLFNRLKDEVYFIDDFSDFTLRHQDSFAGVPRNPYDVEFDAEWGELSFNVPAFSTEGDVLKTDSLYYVIYVDDQEWTFTTVDYDVEKDMTEVPWDFDSYEIMNYYGPYRVVEMYVEGLSSIGVQSVYLYEGEETRSEIVTVEVDDPTSVKTVDASAPTVDVRYYDLNGRRVSAPESGVYVKVTRLADGSVRTSKGVR